MDLVNTFRGFTGDLPILTEFGYVETRFLRPGISCITLWEGRIIKNKILQIKNSEQEEECILIKTKKSAVPLLIPTGHKILAQTIIPIGELQSNNEIATFIGFSNIKRCLPKEHTLKEVVQFADKLVELENTLFRTLFHNKLGLRLNRESRKSKFLSAQFYLSSKKTRFPRGLLRASIEYKTNLLKRLGYWGNKFVLRFSDVIDCYNCLEALEPIGYSGKIQKVKQQWNVTLKPKIEAFHSSTNIRYLERVRVNQSFSLLCSYPSLIAGTHLIYSNGLY